MRRPIPRLIAVTACAAVILAWLLLPGHLSTAQAFNMIADTIVQAKTAKFQMEVAVEGQPKQKFQAWYMAPAKYRQELGIIVNIADLEAGKIVSLLPSQKKVMIMNLKGKPKKKTPGNYVNYFDELRKLLQDRRNATDEQFEKLGEKEIAGKKAVGFRSATAAATVTLWGDPQTKQPLRIETIWTGIPRTEVVMTDFVMNVELKAALFDQTPPAGYKVQSIDVDASDPTEKDLVAAFKACAEISGGEFPDSLDTAGVNKLVINYALKAGKNITDEKIQGLMKESIKIGRGFMFVVQLPESAEPTYAGKGVKRDAKQRPIFWYKPAGTAKYRVIFADLTVHEADTAPGVAGAKRIERGGAKRQAPEK